MVAGAPCYIIASNKDVKYHSSDYLYSFFFPLTGKEMLELGSWMDASSLGGDWIIGYRVTSFNSKEDAAMFKLTWCDDVDELYEQNKNFLAWSKSKLTVI
jgi:hypothetical protein